MPVAHKNTVIQSINLDGESVCVDVFQRPNGTFGFDEFRRDAEDGRGWFSIGHFGDRVFGSADEAMAAAKQQVAWLNDL